METQINPKKERKEKIEKEKETITDLYTRVGRNGEENGSAQVD